MQVQVKATGIHWTLLQAHTEPVVKNGVIFLLKGLETIGSEDGSFCMMVALVHAILQVVG